MRIGTDISLRTSWEEGYMCMEYKVRELFPHGRKNELDKDAYVRFYHSDGGAFGKWCKVKILDTEYSFNDLLELYRKYQKEVDDMCGFTPDMPRPGMNKPCEYVMLSLASDLDSYCGLE